jgi:hypothetical protein
MIIFEIILQYLVVEKFMCILLSFVSEIINKVCKSLSGTIIAELIVKLDRAAVNSQLTNI